MKKKVLAVVMMMAMAVSLIAGCGGKEKEADGDKIKLTFLDKHPEEEYKGYFEQAIADFEDAHPDVDIEYENISDQAIKEKLSVLAAGHFLRVGWRMPEPLLPCRADAGPHPIYGRRPGMERQLSSVVFKQQRV